MAILSKNVQLHKAKRLSSWRKIAIGTWHGAGDPTVYGILELEVDKALEYIQALANQTGQRITISHFMGKAAAETLKRHPEINCLLRFGRIYPRKNIDIFFQVATDKQGHDLSGLTIRNADHKSISEIAKDMEGSVESVRAKGDPSFSKMKNLMKQIPGLLTRWLLNTTGFFMYALNLWSPLLGTPKDPFGSVMITNVGSLGLDLAFAPLVPYSRVPLLLSVGAVRDQVVVRNGEICVVKMLKIGATFDHRIIDGLHGSHMVHTLQKIFADPEGELGVSISKEAILPQYKQAAQG